MLYGYKYVLAGKRSEAIVFESPLCTTHEVAVREKPYKFQFFFFVETQSQISKKKKKTHKILRGLTVKCVKRLNLS